MPTYKSAGVTATLSITELQPTLGGQRPGMIADKKGKGKKDSKQTEIDRVAALFKDNGRDLGETPIPAFGSERRVVQFIGEYEDMPLVMVETGQHLEEYKPVPPPPPRELVPDPSLPALAPKPSEEVQPDAAPGDSEQDTERTCIQRDSMVDTSQQPQQPSAPIFALNTQRDSLVDILQQPPQPTAPLPTAPVFAQKAPSGSMPWALAPKEDVSQNNPASGERPFAQRDSINQPSILSSADMSSADAASQSLPAQDSSRGPAHLPPHGSSRENSMLNSPSTSIALQPFPDFSEAEAYHEAQSQSQGQALMLTVTLNYASFLPDLVRKPGKRGSASANHSIADLRTEVFMNGQLVGWDYQNPRRGIISPEKSLTLRFLGTRFDRSMEKPWTYQSSYSASYSPITAQERWVGIAELLRQEVKDRGEDKWGVRPPSADYLDALSALPLPERFVNKDNLGVIDVIVTVGNGRKYSSTSSYITSPKRMESSKFRFGPHPREPSPELIPPPQEGPASDDRPILSSSDTPLAQRSRGTRRTGHQTLASGEIGEDGLPKPLNAMETPWIRDLIAWFNLKTGQRQFLAEALVGQGGNELRQRLGPLSTLPPFERDVAIFSLIDELRRERASSTPAAPPNAKKPRIDLTTEESAATPDASMPPPDATGDRESSHAGSSAQATPSIDASQTPQRITKRPPAQRGTGRYRGMDPKTREASAVAGATAFVIPELCYDSAVSYAGGDIHRPAPWVRPGEFDEQQFVVGMRFVVI